MSATAPYRSALKIWCAACGVDILDYVYTSHVAAHRALSEAERARLARLAARRSRSVRHPEEVDEEG